MFTSVLTLSYIKTHPIRRNQTPKKEYRWRSPYTNTILYNLPIILERCIEILNILMNEKVIINVIKHATKILLTSSGLRKPTR